MSHLSRVKPWDEFNNRGEVGAPFVFAGETGPLGRIIGNFAAAEDIVLFYLSRVGKSVDNIFHSLGPALRANPFLV